MKYDVVVIGGSATGVVAAKVALETYKDKKVAVIRKEEISMIPCGIPYTLNTLNSVDEDIMPIAALKKAGITFIIDEVVDVSAEKKEVVTSKNGSVQYEKLVFATGSNVFVPPITGFDLTGVYSIKKDYDYMVANAPKLKSAKDVVVIGAGFIGVETADELKKNGSNVTVVEAQDRVLPIAFDSDVSDKLEEQLKKNGINLKLSSKVKSILGEDGNVTAVELEGGDVVKADVVIMAIGYRPNTELAKKMGVALGVTGGINVDEYMKTNLEDVFAAGDCAEHKDFFTNKPSRLMLASAATYDARIAAMNLYSINTIRKIKGTVSIFSTAINGLVVGAAGLTENDAKKGHVKYTVGVAETMDTHPGKLPGTSKQYLKMIFATDSGILLGAQIYGGKSVGELINVLGTAIQYSMTASDLSLLQFATQPLLTSSPTKYPIVNAAKMAFNKMRKTCK